MTIDAAPPDLTEPIWPPDDRAEAGVDVHALLVNDRLRRLRADRDARALLNAEIAGPPAEFIDGTLDALWDLAPDPDPIIERLLPDGGNLLVNAQRKAGKTVAVLNIADALTTGAAFLGSLDVQKLDGRFGILNYELTPGLFTAYSQSLIHQPRNVYANHLLGRPNPFATPEGRDRLAQRFRQEEIEVWAADPWASLYTGQSDVDNQEVRAFLDELMRWTLQDAGCRGFILANHSGWNGERSRGASAIEDWANVIAGLRFEDPGDPTSARYFSAFGRLGHLAEDRLDFSTTTGRLTLTGAGSRKQAATRQHLHEYRDAILDLLRSHPGGLSGKELSDLHGTKDATFTRAREHLVAAGQVDQIKRPGRGGGWLYTVSSPKVPNLPEPTEPARSEPAEPASLSAGSGSVPTASPAAATAPAPSDATQDDLLTTILGATSLDPDEEDDGPDPMREPNFAGPHERVANGSDSNSVFTAFLRQAGGGESS